MADDEPSMDDIDPADVFSEEFMILLRKQTKALNKLIEQQQEIMAVQRARYGTDEDDESEDGGVDEFQSIPEQGFY